MTLCSIARSRGRLHPNQDCGSGGHYGPRHLRLPERLKPEFLGRVAVEPRTIVDSVAACSHGEDRTPWWLLLPDGSYRGVNAAERRREVALPEGARLYKSDNLQSQGAAREAQPFPFEGKKYHPGANSHWKPNYPEGLERLAKAGRIQATANSLRYRRFASDFPYRELGNLWTDTTTGGFNEEKRYVVQTNTKVIERCLLLTSDPGDLVLDPTCGSGTTAWCAEKWGRSRQQPPKCVKIRCLYRRPMQLLEALHVAADGLQVGG